LCFVLRTIGFLLMLFSTKRLLRRKTWEEDVDSVCTIHMSYGRLLMIVGVLISLQDWDGTGRGSAKLLARERWAFDSC